MATSGRDAAIFGGDWEHLALEDIRSFLHAAGDEDDRWEAKGPDVDRGEIRRQFCGFANSRHGGYLLLGVARDASGWTMEGRAFEGRSPEPAVWIDSIVRDGGRLQPVPSFSTRSFPVGPGRYVTVTRVLPVTASPCVLDGVVHIRADGRTVPVRDLAQLRALFSDGQRVLEAAREDATAVAADVYDWGYAQERNRASYLQGAVGVASTTRASDAAARVFDPIFHKHLDQFLEYKALRRDGHGIRQRPDWAERAYTLGGPITHAIEKDAYVAVRCDVRGMVGVYFREQIDDGTIDELMAWWVYGAWQTAIATQVFLGGAEDYFASLVINGRGLSDAPRRPDRISVTQGPLALSRRQGRFDFLSFGREAEAHLAPVRRDVLRAVGRPAHEAALPPDANDPIWHIHYDPDGQQSEWSPWDVRRDLAIGRRRGRRRD